MNDSIKSIQALAKGIRRRVLGLTLRNNGYYLSQALSSAEILACLYGKIMKLGHLGCQTPPLFPGTPKPGHCVTGGSYNGPKGPDLDRFILSPTHYAGAVYATLVETGRLSEEAFLQINMDGSSLEMIGAEHSPGMELTSGSFGQALSQSIGICLARKQKGDTGRTWVFMSDGEFEEGQTYEALHAGAFHRCDNLAVIADINGQQVDGLTKDVMNIEPLYEKMQAFGWAVHRVDGHDIEAILKASQVVEGKPVLILAYTNTAEGLPDLESRKPNLHYVRFKTSEEIAHYQSIYESMSQGA